MCDNLISPLFQKSVPLTVVPASLSNTITNYTNTCEFPDYTTTRKLSSNNDSSCSCSSSSSSCSSSNCCSSSSSSSIPNQEPIPALESNTLRCSSFFNAPDLVTIPTEDDDGALYTLDGYYRGWGKTTDPIPNVPYIFNVTRPHHNISSEMTNSFEFNIVHWITIFFNIWKDPITSKKFIRLTEIPDQKNFYSATGGKIYALAALGTNTDIPSLANTSYAAQKLVTEAGNVDSTFILRNIQDIGMLVSDGNNGPDFEIDSKCSLATYFALPLYPPQQSIYESEINIKLKSIKDKCGCPPKESVELYGDDYKCGNLTSSRVMTCNTPTQTPNKIHYKVKASRDTKNEVKLSLTYISDTYDSFPFYNSFFQANTEVALYHDGPEPDSGSTSPDSGSIAKGKIRIKDNGKLGTTLHIPIDIFKHHKSFHIMTNTTTHVTSPKPDE